MMGNKVSNGTNSSLSTWKNSHKGIKMSSEFVVATWWNNTKNPTSALEIFINRLLICIRLTFGGKIEWKWRKRFQIEENSLRKPVQYFQMKNCNWKGIRWRKILNCYSGMCIKGVAAFQFCVNMSKVKWTNRWNTTKSHTLNFIIQKKTKVKRIKPLMHFLLISGNARYSTEILAISTKFLARGRWEIRSIQ